MLTMWKKINKQRLAVLFAGVVFVSLLVGFLVIHFFINPNRWKKAEDYYRVANYPAAAALLEKTGLPTDSAKLMIYGNVMLSTQHYEQASTAYTTHYQQTGDPNSLLLAGNVASLQHHYSEADQDYQTVITRNPQFVQAYVNLATNQVAESHTSDALSTIQKGISATPNAVSLYVFAVQLQKDQPQSAGYHQAWDALHHLDASNAALAVKPT